MRSYLIPREARPDCPPTLAAFFASALAANRSRRPQTAAEFSNQLRRAVPYAGASR